ncbi:hypothetical protein BDY19DRAFT_743 [Irpex rosettiformis]|uniref:Uncharacterized protein n=1 Tax=Irpex rosettiformis TaxID=378272 RepID=A0ACB8UIG5_9APHY|nr:hypothetical protein BDY19DRAFT_743 [Irpex rosettiformis]
MKYVEWDALRSASWALLSSSGSYTGHHHDAGGYFTFVKCETGAKLWCYLRPKVESGEIVSDMNTLVDIIADCLDTNSMGKHAEPVSLVLKPGTILIQPAGCIHLVYTLENSVFTGGHFFMLDGMHFTEVTRACAVATRTDITNAFHPGCIRSLCRIALSIIYNHRQSVLRKPFISLARMLVWSDLYASGDISSKEDPFLYNTESDLELEAARAAVELVLEHNNIRLEDIRPKDLMHREWLASTEAGADWRDPGTETLAVPDKRDLFNAFKGVAL